MPEYKDESVATFDKNAARYAERFFALPDYEDFYAWLVAATPQGPARFFGPGRRPDLSANLGPDAMTIGPDLARSLPPGRATAFRAWARRRTSPGACGSSPSSMRAPIHCV